MMLIPRIEIYLPLGHTVRAAFRTLRLICQNVKKTGKGHPPRQMYKIHLFNTAKPIPMPNLSGGLARFRE